MPTPKHDAALATPTTAMDKHSDDLASVEDLEAAPGSATYVDSNDAAYQGHARRPRLCARYGRTYVLCSSSSDYGYFPLTAHVGPHWPCMLITYTIAIGPVFLVLLDDSFKTGFRVALLATSVLTTLVFSLVACSDPGIIYDNDMDLPYLTGDHRAGVICAQCQVRRPKTASHCSDCGVCVNKLDHHCPWTGKCIGVRTLLLFYGFLWCISIHIILLSVGCTITYLNR